MRRRSRGEDGAALAFGILVVMALLTVAHGALVAALAERSASRAAARELRLRGAADRALAEGLARPAASWMDSLGAWEAREYPLAEPDSGDVEVIFRRLAAESWLIEGRARTPVGVIERSLRVAWSLDPLTRVLALTGAISVGTGAPAVLSGSVDVGAPAAIVPPMEATACDPWRLALQVELGALPMTAVAPLPDTTAPTLGLLDLDRLLGLAPASLTEAGTPAPAESAGVCLVAEPWGWGDPDAPWRPCGAHVPMRRRVGDLLVDGGVGQALLVVDGDLTLDAGARLYGVVVVSGTLRLTGGAAFDGLALAAGGAYVESGTSFRASACWAVRALSANRSLLGTFVPLGATRLGPV